MDRLEKAGLAERRPSPSDRRSVLVRLTPTGLGVVDRAVAADLARQQSLLSHLSPTAQRRLADLLRAALEPYDS